MTRVVVLDLETTHREPEKAHVVEWAAVIVEPAWFGIPPRMTAGSLVKPPIPIPPETSAVHHIIDADVAVMPTWELAQRDLIDLFQEDPEVIAVAHNANFERTVLAPLNLKCRWLCTYKAAVRVWPDAPGHGNETLRYYLGLGTGRAGVQRPHSALHDAEVTADLFNELIRAGTAVDDMLAWTEQPALLPWCPIGDWRGTKWSEIEESFLLWILRKIHDREDVRFCAETELKRREDERRKEREAASAGSTAATAQQQTEDDADIPF